MNPLGLRELYRQCQRPDSDGLRPQADRVHHDAAALRLVHGLVLEPIEVKIAVEFAVDPRQDGAEVMKELRTLNDIEQRFGENVTDRALDSIEEALTRLGELL